MISARRKLLRDSRLAIRVRNDDDRAFGVLSRRYRTAMRRYAKTLLRGTGLDADAVVEDALHDAHATMLAGRKRTPPPRALFFSLTRTHAIDEVRNHRSRAEGRIDEHEAEDENYEAPPAESKPRGRRRRLVADLSELSFNQTYALLGRAIDGRSHVALAGDLHISETASRMLAVRARENLTGAPPPRTTECTNVRIALEDRHQRSAQKSNQVREHLRDCDACRRYRKGMRRLGRRLSRVSPSSLNTGLATSGRVLGGGGPFLMAIKLLLPIAALAGAGVAVYLVFFHKDKKLPTKVTASNIRVLTGRQRMSGQVIPHGAALVRADIFVPAGHRNRHVRITLHCPAGLYYATANDGNNVAPAFVAASGTKRGARHSLTFRVAGPPLHEAKTITATVLCEKPKAKAPAKKKSATTKHKKTTSKSKSKSKAKTTSTTPTTG